MEKEFYLIKGHHHRILSFETKAKAALYLENFVKLEMISVDMDEIREQTKPYRVFKEGEFSNFIDNEILSNGNAKITCIILNPEFYWELT